MVTPLDRRTAAAIFVAANMATFPSAAELLVTVAEPTRLRILNCLAAAPLFVSDLQDVLELPQPTVSRHLTILRKADLVRDTPVAPFVLYRLCRDTGARGRLVKAILESLGAETEYRRERTLALERSRSRGGSVLK